MPASRDCKEIQKEPLKFLKLIQKRTMTNKYWSYSFVAAFVLLGVAAQAQEEETTSISTGPPTDEALCNGLVQEFYLDQDDETGSSLIRENDSCSCKVTDDNAFFVVECRLDYCQECNEAGVCGLTVLSNRYNAETLRQGEGDNYIALADFSQCYEYSQGRTDTACVITNPEEETCRLEVDGSPCQSCSLDYTICPTDGGGRTFDCTNLEGGIAFNSCNEVSDTTQAVELNSPFAFADSNSMVFESCNDPKAQVITPPPTIAPAPEQDTSSGPSPSSTNEASSGTPAVVCTQKFTTMMISALLGSALLFI